MNKLIFIFLSLPLSAMAMSQQAQLNMMHAQIATLEKQHAEKLAALQKCEKETKNFKIAGISTLATTGIGIYANVALHKKLTSLNNNNSGSGGGTAKPVVRTVTEQQAQDNELCQIDPALCEE